jgi:DNA-binding transcriptional ArsR family regulator
MSRLGSILVALIGFAILSTVFASIHLLTLSGNRLQDSLPAGSSTPQSLLFLLPAVRFLSNNSFVLAPTSWLLVGGVWMWRGRLKSRWEELGFDSDVFQLFVKMKGGRTKLKVMNALGKPKDRYQLAKELGLDWRAVDQHLVALARCGLVSNDVVYGKVRMYALTSSGTRLLRLLEDMNAETDKIPAHID